MSRCVHRRDASSQAIFARLAPGDLPWANPGVRLPCSMRAGLDLLFRYAPGRACLGISRVRLPRSMRPGFDLLLYGMPRATCLGKSRCASAAQHEGRLESALARYAPGRACFGRFRRASAVQHEAGLNLLLHGLPRATCPGRFRVHLPRSMRPGLDLLFRHAPGKACLGISQCASAAQHEAHLELPLQPPPGDLARPRVRLTGAPAVQPVRAGSHAAASPALSARCPAGVCRAHSRTPLRHRPAAFARPFCPGFLEFISRVARASRGNA